MNGAFKRPRKRQRRNNHHYLLTSSSSWVLDKVVPTTSALLVASYNDTIQFEQTVIKEEPEGENSESASSEAFILPKDGSKKSSVKIDKDTGDLLSIKIEENCEEGDEIDLHNSSIDTDGTAELIGTELKDESEEGRIKGVKEKLTILNSLPSVYGRIKTVDGVIRYECDFCKKLFKCRCDIAAHRRYHTKERNFKCNTCTKSFFSTSDLRRHVNIVHNERNLVAKQTDGMFKCDKCGKAYKTLNGFKGHTCKMFKCDKCKKTYKTSETLKCHVCEQVSTCEKCKREVKKVEHPFLNVNFECYYCTALETLKANKLGVHKAGK